MSKKTDTDDSEWLPGPIWRDLSRPPSVTRLFRLMRLAEDEIAVAKRKYKDKESELSNALFLFRPTGILQDRPTRVYRAHCRELVLRVVKERDTRLGTAAEILCRIMDSCELHPVDPDDMDLARRLSASVMGPGKLPGSRGQLTWTREVREHLVRRQHKMSQPWRQLTRY
jgi:hypothetical protein